MNIFECVCVFVCVLSEGFNKYVFQMLTTSKLLFNDKKNLYLFQLSKKSTLLTLQISSNCLIQTLT